MAKKTSCKPKVGSRVGAKSGGSKTYAKPAMKK